MDPYVYPGTNVLRNLRGFRDADLLSEFEAEATSRRIRQLHRRPITGAFDAAHLRAIHRYIFQDLFDWAGEFRTVNIQRGSQMPFALHELIAPCLSTVFGKLAKERPLTPFFARAAYYLGEINAIHPFREGNGRTQREFIRELATTVEVKLEWQRINRDEMIEASIASFHRCDNSGFERLLTTAATPLAT